MKRDWLFLLLLSGLILLPGLGTFTLKRQQELRVALCARGMAQGGSWLVPVFQGQPRLRKPPLMYWMVAPGLKVFDAPATARLPGALCGAGLLLAIAGVGSRLIGRRRALVAACIAATTLAFLRHARLAELDIALNLFTTLSVGALFAACFHQDRWKWWLLAGGCMGIAFMVKGPAAIAVPVLTVLVAGALNRSALLRIRPARILAALALCALIAAPWYVYITWIATLPEGVLGQELSDTFVDSPHAGPVWYYLYTLPKMLLPWALVLPFALPLAWRAARHHAGLRLVWTWFLVTFFELSMISSKQDHYAILLLVPSALLLAPWVYRFGRRIRLPWKPWKALLLAASGFLMTFYTLAVYPKTEGEAWIPGFLERIRVSEGSPERVHVVGVNSAIFEYYLRRGVDPTDSIAYAYRRARPGDIVVVIQKAKKIEPGDLPKVKPTQDGTRRGLRFMLYRKT